MDMICPNTADQKLLAAHIFFTVVTYCRQPILTSEVMRHSLREGIIRAQRTLPFKIEAWVLLPDHLHCIWTLPEDDANFSSRWAIIKRHVSKEANEIHLVRETHPTRLALSDSRLKRKETTIWQRRFWEHLIRDETDFRRHLDYIHWNPVKHGYVSLAADWSFSTFHRFAKDGIYPKDWGGDVAADKVNFDYGE